MDFELYNDSVDDVDTELINLRRHTHERVKQEAEARLGKRPASPEARNDEMKRPRMEVPVPSTQLRGGQAPTSGIAGPSSMGQL